MTSPPTASLVCADEGKAPTKSRWIEWIEANVGRPLVGFEITAAQVLCDAYGAPWNSPWQWSNVKWGPAGGVSVCATGRGMATWDNDRLTRLVVAAHDKCARVCVDPATPRHLRIILHPRVRDETFSRGHPTIEEAIARFRQSRSASHTPVSSDTPAPPAPSEIEGGR